MTQSYREDNTMIDDIKRSKSPSEAADSNNSTNIEVSTKLERAFDGFMSFSFSFSSIAVITSLCLVIDYGLNTGGPSVIVLWLDHCFNIHDMHMRIHG